MQRILIVDDDRVLADVVSYLLRREGLEPVAAHDAATATRLFGEQPPDLVILDVNLGDADGRDLLRLFHEQRPQVLILMLTALGSEEDRVSGLQLGADDYLSKPFGHRELIARVRALLRRVKADPRAGIPTRIQVGSLVLDAATHEVSRSGHPLDLTPTEFRLLQTLLEHPDQVVPARTVLRKVWNHEDMSARNVLRVTASRLRAKLQVDSSMPPMLQTVPGEGLMIRSDAVAVAVPPAGLPASPARPDVVPAANSEMLHSAPPVSDEQAIAFDVVAELQELMAGTGGHPLRQLNDVFVDQAGKHMEAMRDSLSCSDAGGVETHAHRLRGTSASMGAIGATSVCGRIEQCARQGELDTVGVLLKELEQEISRYEIAIAPMLD